MAIFPCDYGLHRYPGPQRTLYPAVVNGARAVRGKRRCCPEHFAALVAFLRSLPEIPDDIGPAACYRPDCLENPAVGFFLTAYDRGQEREDFYFRSCETHARDHGTPLLFGTKIDPGEATEPV